MLCYFNFCILYKRTFIYKFILKNDNAKNISGFASLKYVEKFPKIKSNTTDI